MNIRTKDTGNLTNSSIAPKRTYFRKHRLLFMAAVLFTLACTVLYYRGLGGSSVAARIAEATPLEWTDLVPPAEPMPDPLAELPMNVRFDLGYIGKVQADATAHLISRDGAEYRNAMMLLEQHRSNGIDVDRLLGVVTGLDREITKRGEALNSSLNGEIVRLPGYVLPLEMNTDGVTEFLLVPFVGACIHVPPPPPNQIVLAQLESAYQVKELYDPVIITGKLSAQPASSEVYLVDGQAQIPMGYSMQVMHVEPVQ